LYYKNQKDYGEYIGEVKKELQEIRRNNVIDSDDGKLKVLCTVSPGEQKEN